MTLIKIRILLLIGMMHYVYSCVLAQEISDKLRISSLSLAESDAKIKNIRIFDDNFIWIASSRGLLQADLNGKLIKNHAENDELVDIVQDKDNQLWAATTNAMLNVQNGYKYPIENPSSTIKGITYHQGSIWLATSSGLLQFNPTTQKYKVYNTKNSKLASNQINFVHADNHKILWVGTAKGYIRIDDNKWELQDTKYQMLATSENHEGQWIATNSDMFLINKFNRLFPVKLDSKQYKGTINSFVIDSKGKIYIASDILSCYDPYTETVINYSDDASILSRAAISLACDKNDNIWVGTDGSGLYRLSFSEIKDENLYTTFIIQSPIKCFGQKNGSIKVSINGGKPPYSILWQNGITTDYLKDVPSGEYKVTVVDQSGASSIASGKLSEPKKIILTNTQNTRVNNTSKPDGSLSVQASGGTNPYLYTWSNNQKTPSINGLNSGLYSVTVTDKNGCSATDEFIVKREKYIPDLEINKVTVGQKLRINELNFQADSSNITSDNFDILNEVFEFLNTHPSVMVEIGGHTNTIPPHEYCDQLSSARAKKVAEYLIKRGIKSERVSHKGYGKREPLTDSISLQGRQKNQRVEIKILQM